MKKSVLLLLLAILLALALTSCSKKTTEVEVDYPQNTVMFSFESPGRSIPMPQNGSGVYVSGNVFGYDHVQQDSLRYIGVWSDSTLTCPVNLGAGNFQIECWYRNTTTHYLYRFYPRISVKVVNQMSSRVFELRHVRVLSENVSDSTGYSAQMYHRMTTEFQVYYDQNGVNIEPLENVDLINAKVTYTGIPDSAVAWPDTLDMTSITEYGVKVAPGDSLFIVSTYNGLAGSKRVAMTWDSSTHAWEFEFPYNPSAGINFRIEKLNGEPLFQGVRLSTSLGSVACTNLHYFPDDSGANTWALFQAGLNNGIPYIPYPEVNDLINAITIIIGR